jgi:DNA-binding NtrC family response regulator
MKATVLLVDDYPGRRPTIGDTLRLEGYDVILASNGKEALHALRRTGFDLVLLDLDRPVHKGWESLCQIITISLALPVINITGRTDPQWMATQKGLTAVLEKPLDWPLLLGVMERALAETAKARQQRGGRR